MLHKILPHICIILSLMMLTFFVIDQVNRAMGFMDNDFFRGLFVIYCLVVAVTAGLMIADNRRQ